MLNFNDLTPGDRIVLRYRLDPQELSGPTLSDAIGHVVEVTESLVVLETRGGIVEIQRSKITNAKRVPPAPPRRRARVDPSSN
ncbi:hypothetical protein AUR04nite_33800 [Glutamicibacter uratoxydans]|uniref:Histone acetyltransferase Rv0428c-like SH3 domain-containing protein n=1 Tax=Glutamicibacter uratoxydans TaxID=43667 RepID=A0A4Y4DWV3_GLUUR|nr:preprotein translocase subunit YajC [Glutamicibacter uratoxydans]GED07848.1 hypothetical protein AUR04nite_33800 [Glutamicibacter uratoxydans]